MSSFISLENDASVEVKRIDAAIEIRLAESAGAAEWSATIQLGIYEARRLRDWLIEELT